MYQPEPVSGKNLPLDQTNQERNSKNNHEEPWLIPKNTVKPTMLNYPFTIQSHTFSFRTKETEKSAEKGPPIENPRSPMKNET